MHHVIVGASAAGLAAAEAILSLEPSADVTLLSEEEHRPYCRPLISYRLAGETPDTLFSIPSPAWTSVTLKTGTRAVSLDPVEKLLRLGSGETLAYDRLCLATGAASKPLGLAGEESPNVIGFRTREDLDGIEAEIASGTRRALVLGGGLVGVKAAHALAARGLETLLCITSEHPLSQAVDATAGAMVLGALEADGVRVCVGHRPAELRVAKGRIAEVRFDPPGRVERCDLVIRGKGVAPRTELAAGFGFEASHGLPVDEHLRTPLPDVWAAGDAAAPFDVAWGLPRINAIWPMAVEQGALAGRNMAGAREPYSGGVGMNSLKVAGLYVVSVGVTRPPDGSFRSVCAGGQGEDYYRKVVTREGRLVGAILAGLEGERDAVHQAGMLVSAVRRGARLEELPFDPLDRRARWDRYAFSRGS